MILTKILENDFHRGKNGTVPYMVEVPAVPEFLPAIVSNTRGEFLTVEKMVANADASRIRVGVFGHESEKIDLIIPSMVKAAFALSVSRGWENVFRGMSTASAAFDYIQEQSGLDGQPHVCLTPSQWEPSKVSRFFGRRKLTDLDTKFNKCCRVVSCNTPIPVFLSRPDYVGMLTYFAGGSFGIVLHNVRRGMAFCNVRCRRIRRVVTH